MTPDEVKKYYKNGYLFNKATGMSAATFGNWMKWGFIPEVSQYKLEQLTGGALKQEERLKAQGDTALASRFKPGSEVWWFQITEKGLHGQKVPRDCLELVHDVVTKVENGIIYCLYGPLLEKNILGKTRDEAWNRLKKDAISIKKTP